MNTEVKTVEKCPYCKAGALPNGVTCGLCDGKGNFEVIANAAGIIDMGRFETVVSGLWDRYAQDAGAWIGEKAFGDACASLLDAAAGRAVGAAGLDGELQNRLIDAVEVARSAKLATNNASPEYGMGYAEAKRDVLIELSKVFAELAMRTPQQLFSFRAGVHAAHSLASVNGLPALDRLVQRHRREWLETKAKRS